MFDIYEDTSFLQKKSYIPLILINIALNNNIMSYYTCLCGILSGHCKFIK